MNPGNGGWVIVLTLVVALLLAIMPLPEWLPDWAGWFRPAWLLLVLFFWTIETPQRLGLIGCWLLGGLVDVLSAEPLGLNGFILALVTFLGWQFYERLRMYSVLQHAVVLFVLLLIVEILRALVLSAVLAVPWSWGFTLTALTSALIWPLVYGLLKQLTRTFRVE